MTRGPDFDEVVGGEPEGAERERLRRAHDLLLAAGPPPELTPELEAGPNLAMTLARRQRQGRRRLALLAAAAVAVAIVFLGGYIAGSRGGSAPTPVNAVDSLNLRGTGDAANALGTIYVLPPDAAGNTPMRLDVARLPALPKRGYYAVYLVRNGKIVAPCGWFVTGGDQAQTDVRLNAPYAYEPGDTWIVTRWLPGTKAPGTTVMRPTA
jgi:hypothetical protein